MLKLIDATHNTRAWLYSPSGGRQLQVLDARERPEPNRLCFFAPDFALSQPRAWLWGEELPLHGSVPRRPLPPLLRKELPKAEDFFSLHASVLNHIRAGALQKAVPMVSERWIFAEALSADMFQPQPKEHQWIYGWESPGEGGVGQTPEILFQVSGDELETMALAGTGPAEGASLLEDPKERREHDWVVQNLDEELRGLGRVWIGETVERTYGILRHLYTPLRVKLNEPPNFEQLVSKLHPTAALGGFPRAAAWQWLRAQPFHHLRGRFGAPFGYQTGDGEMLCVVAIRGVQWQGREATWSSGCGVVEGSVAEREWSELALKRSATLRNLQVSL